MIKRLMQCLIAALVALVFGGVPTLVFAGDASPPLELCAIAPDVELAIVQLNGYANEDASAHRGKIVEPGPRRSICNLEPGYPLRE